MRHQFVVAVHKEDIFAFSLVDTTVAGSGHTLVALGDYPQVRVSGSVLHKQFCCVVGASVIYNNHLIIFELLREDAVETPLQVGFGVIGGYDDGKTH